MISAQLQGEAHGRLCCWLWTLGAVFWALHCGKICPEAGLRVGSCYRPQVSFEPEPCPGWLCPHAAAVSAVFHPCSHMCLKGLLGPPLCLSIWSPHAVPHPPYIPCPGVACLWMLWFLWLLATLLVRKATEVILLLGTAGATQRPPERCLLTVDRCAAHWACIGSLHAGIGELTL